MNIKEKIQDFFNSEKIDLEVVDKDTVETPEVKEEVKAKFVDATLQDGTVVQIEPAVEVGAAVVVVLEDEVVPAPDGDHVLEDNTVITVEGGLITNVQSPEDVEDEAVEELDKETTVEAETKADREAKKVIESIITEKQFSELVEKVENLEKESKFLKEENEALTALFNSNKKELGELFKELFAEPTEEPIKKQKNPLKKETKNIFLKVKKQ